MIPLFADNASTTLAAGISSSATTVLLAAGTGAEFPSPITGEFFTLTLNDQLTGNVYEICYCTARTGDSLTVMRGQEGTTAVAWLLGDYAYNAWTAAVILAIINQSVGGVLTGNLPSPGMAAGAAAANIGGLGGGLTGTLPNPGLNAFSNIYPYPSGRYQNTTYTNSTGFPMFVTIDLASTGSSSFAFLINGNTSSQSQLPAGGGNVTLYGMVPNGMTYEVVTVTFAATLNGWLEVW
jgi:hypothetical protein